MSVFQPSWSPDSRWVAYAKPEVDGPQRVYLHSLETKQTIPASDAWFNSSEPIFSSDGTLLFFVSARSFNPTYGQTEFQHIYGDMTRIYFVTLAKDTKSPLAPRSDEVKINIIHRGVGVINESDVLLASASNAVIIGFHSIATPRAQQLAKLEKVDLRHYDIIYRAIDDIKAAMAGLLEPVIVEREIGEAEVRAVFSVSKVGAIAGCYVLSGTITRNGKARVRRGVDVIHQGAISSLKRFKDDVREVEKGLECGLTLEGVSDYQPGDPVEFPAPGGGRREAGARPGVPLRGGPGGSPAPAREVGVAVRRGRRSLRAARRWFGRRSRLEAVPH